MQWIIVDYETYYSKEYSLRLMTPAQYILDPRFECTGAGIKPKGQPSFWVNGPDLAGYFATVDWSQTAHISHNAGFDAAISSWMFGLKPALWGDTLAMARAIVYHQLGRISLDAVSKHLGLPLKSGALANALGYRYADLVANPQIFEPYKSYACQDADNCEGIFLALRSNFTAEEFIIMDMVIRMVANPQFTLNRQVLTDHLAEVQREKEELLNRLGLHDDTLLQSNDRFAEMLHAAGVVPPRKVSAKTGKEAWAFSKQDKEFLDLQDHPDENVQALMAARFGHKSTLEETRTERFINIADLTWPTHLQKPEATILDRPPHLFPVPLKYSGAHTHRLSGDWKINAQNMRRGGKLRDSLEAPPGYTVVTADASQVEARMDAWWAGQDDLVAAFLNGDDIYSNFAGDIYKRLITKRLDPIERFIGKQCILGLGFGLGHVKFAANIPVLSRNQIGTEIPMPLEQAKSIVGIYRTKYTKIALLWKRCDNLIEAMHAGRCEQWGPVFTRKNEIVLPSGLRLQYVDLQRCSDPVVRADGSIWNREGWKYRYGNEWKRLYGAKLCENVVQSLARIVTMSTAVRMRRRVPQYPLAHQVHDELIYVVRNNDVDWFRPVLESEMVRADSWADGLPLATELGQGQSYGAAK